MRTSARAVSSMILLLGMGVVNLRADEPAKQVQPTKKNEAAKKNEPARKIEGWGVVEDPTAQSKIDFDKKTLTLAPATRYVDNFPKGMVNAPRVVQEVSGDFTVQVNVIHVDDAKPDSVLKSLGGFPTAYHAGTLLLRLDDQNLVRLERVKMNAAGNHRETCDLQLWNKNELQFHTAFEIEDRPTILKLERRGTKLAASYSQDEGENWKRFPEQPIEYLPSKIRVGVSMTSNTDPACKVQFQDFKLDASEQ